MKILNLHRKKTANVGDLRCAPYLYFPELLGDLSREVLSFHQGSNPEREDRVEFNDLFAESNVIVFGGGGLLEIDFFNPIFKYLAERKLAHHKTIIWGAGHNNWILGDWRKMRQDFTFDRDLFDLIGVRDYNQDLDWVPCVSCMSPAFDQTFQIKREVGLYAHAGTLKNEAFRRRLPEGIETISNSSTFEDAIRFLGESELVLTDSFHGVFWAQMLGRKVVGFPSSSKFYSLKHVVPLCAPEDWQRYARLAQVYPEARDECRQANKDFAARVGDVIAQARG